MTIITRSGTVGTSTFGRSAESSQDLIRQSSLIGFFLDPVERREPDWGELSNGLAEREFKRDNNPYEEHSCPD